MTTLSLFYYFHNKSTTITSSIYNFVLINYQSMGLLSSRMGNFLSNLSGTLFCTTSTSYYQLQTVRSYLQSITSSTWFFLHYINYILLQLHQLPLIIINTSFIAGIHHNNINLFWDYQLTSQFWQWIYSMTHLVTRFLLCHIHKYHQCLSATNWFLPSNYISSNLFNVCM